MQMHDLLLLKYLMYKNVNILLYMQSNRASSIESIIKPKEVKYPHPLTSSPLPIVPHQLKT